MGRSIKKGPFVEEKLMRKVLKQKETGAKDPIRTWSRSSTILPEFVSHTFLVHNGKSFNKVLVVEDLVGHKLGEFAPTRTFRGHTAKKKK
ncbi:MAG: 30S ribosomal protein S19 [Planctomycetes bacterium]|nr:30S ribosomal protein S19 [Planctomycetota bacterium]